MVYGPDHASDPIVRVCAQYVAIFAPALARVLGHYRPYLIPNSETGLGIDPRGKDRFRVTCLWLRCGVNDNIVAYPVLDGGPLPT